MTKRLEELTIGDLVATPPVQTVIRVEQGRTEAEGIVGSFVVTDEVGRHLDILAGRLRKPNGAGCFLQGDFGSGKSHLLALLYAYLSRETLPEKAAAHGSLRMLALEKRMLPVALSLVNYRGATPLERIVCSAIETALADRGIQAALSPLRAFLAHLRQLTADPSFASAMASAAEVEPDALDRWIDEHPRDAYTAGASVMQRKGLTTPDELMPDREELFRRAMAAVGDAGFDGVVLLMDELSEFLRSKPTSASLNDDARMLQFLGEQAHGRPIWTLAAVQESVERTGDIAQVTIKKIKDRFPLRFHLSTVHIRGLIEHRLAVNKEGSGEYLNRIHDRLRTRFTSFPADFGLFRAVYPLHPETLTLLEGLSDLFSQHRGIVDFVHTRVAGDPSRPGSGCLDRHCLELLAPDAIYEHFAPRLMEISSMHQFPRHIVPHLERVIEDIAADETDRALLRRLIRMLVLYAVHPTARPPSARKLAELASCAVSEADPDANAQYVAEVLLGPLALQSSFLQRLEAPDGDPLDAAYQITAQEDSTKVLRARIDQRIKETQRTDSRTLLGPLCEFEVAGVWPGVSLGAEGVETARTWRGSLRHILAVFVPDGGQMEARGKIESALESGRIDCAVAFVFGDTEFTCRHTATWRIRLPDDGVPDVLVEYHAMGTVMAELRPGNPVEAPLIPVCRDARARCGAAAREAVVSLVYGGRFDDASLEMRLEPAARKLQHFERLMDIAVQGLCEQRYPRFLELGLRSVPPLVQLRRVLHECIIPGSLPVRRAHERALTEPLDGAAIPLGLVELQRGSYVLAPNPSEHPLLNEIFAGISPGAPTPLGTMLHALRTGPFGLPDDLTAFVLIGLAHSGLVTLRSGNGAIPLERLQSLSLQSVQSIAPGELLPEADRHYLMENCRFLAPQGGWDTFGLRRQREAWQQLLRLEKSLRRMLEDFSHRLSEARTYSAFRAFDLEKLGSTAAALSNVLDEIRVSYGAREGLQRFLDAWRRSGLRDSDIELLKSLQRFFARWAQEFIFIDHYLRHRSVEAAGARHDRVGRPRSECTAMTAAPMERILADDGERLRTVFDEFRSVYAEIYARDHEAFYKAQRPAPIPRHARRGIDLLRLLATTAHLDHPPEVQRELASLETPGARTCGRNPTEALLRAPVCDCGFCIGDEPPDHARPEPAAVVERGLNHYLRLLRTPQVLEAVAARAFALRDEDPEASRRLQSLKSALEGNTAAAPSALLGALDAATVSDLDAALAGTVPLVGRSLRNLATTLAGRRLTRQRIAEAVEEWVGDVPDNGLVVIDKDSSEKGGTDTRPFWWALLNRDLLGAEPHDLTQDEAAAAAAACEAAFPASELLSRFRRLAPPLLAEFMSREVVHTEAAAGAWRLLAHHVLRGDAGSEPLPTSSAHLDGDTADSIRTRLRALEACRSSLRRPLPYRLTSRCRGAAIAADVWATGDMSRAAYHLATTLEDEASTWLKSLPPVASLDLSDSPVVVVLDAVAPDVWIAGCEEAGLDESVQTGWLRLPCTPATLASLRVLFDIETKQDPIEALSARDIDYTSIDGTESAAAADLITLQPSMPAVVRVSALDKAAHHGTTLRLNDMPGALAGILTRHVRSLARRCNEENRRLVVTADHGLSWGPAGFSHGKECVFESAVFVAEGKAFI